MKQSNGKEVNHQIMSSHHERSPTWIYVPSQETVRAAIQGWGSTARLILIILAVAAASALIIAGILMMYFSV